MLKNKREKINTGNISKIFVVFMVVGGFTVYGLVSLYFQTSNQNLNHFVDGFDVYSSLTRNEDINFDFMRRRVEDSEEIIGLYHIPRNLTGNNWPLVPLRVNFDYTKIDKSLPFFNKSFFNNTQLLSAFDPTDVNSPYNNLSIMTYGGDTAHVALYTGVYVAGEAFRYAVAKRESNKVEIEASLKRLRDLVDAYEILSEVAGNHTWPRYAVPITDTAKALFPGYGFEATPDRDIVEYRGYNWSLINHKSRDVTCGQLFAMSMIHNLVDDPDLKRRTGRIIDRTVHYFYESNWRIFDVDGTQHTTASELMNARPSPSSLFPLSFLKMAAIVNPVRWQSIYLHYAYDRGFAKALGKSDRAGVGFPASNVFGAYYSMNFIYNDVLTLIWLEEDPVLKQIYLNNLLDEAQNFCKFHRNAMFDITYLLCHSTPDFDDLTNIPTLDKNDINNDDQVWSRVRDKIDDPYEFVVADIKDCIWRSINRKYPYRNYYVDVLNFGDEDANPHQTPIPNVPYPNIGYWGGEEGTDWLDALEDIIEGKSPTEKPRNLLNNSMPVDLRKSEDMMWQRKSYGIENVNYISTRHVGWSQIVPDILYVYWVGRYLDIIPKY